MTTPDTSTRSVIVEKEFPHPPEKVWRALTESSLIEQWLMKNDFLPVAGHSFSLRMDPVPNWNGVIDCRVLAVEPLKALLHLGHFRHGNRRPVYADTTSAGTHVRVEQSGFRADQEANYKGAQYGWKKFLGNLEPVVAGLE